MNLETTLDIEGVPVDAPVSLQEMLEQMRSAELAGPRSSGLATGRWP